MESLFGFTGDGYTIIVADSAAMRSVVKFKDTEDKIIEVDAHKLMGVTGPNGDRVHFTEYILRNLHLYELRNGITLSTHAAANFTRCVNAAVLLPFLLNRVFSRVKIGNPESPVRHSLTFLLQFFCEMCAPRCSGELANALRRNPYEVSLLIGGHDGAEKGASLYFMDHMASLIKVDKAAHGYCSYFILRCGGRVH